jgi:DNA polymerase-3 subunit alpha (Gram-positive type)
MERKPMDFTDAFPNLKVSSELNELLQGVIVERITLNQNRNNLHVYVSSRNWISKQYVYELEDAIASQIFDNVTMEVKIVEKFQLSSQYTPANFFKVYRPSILLELKTRSNLIHQLFLHADVEFPNPRTVEMTMPDDILYQSHEKELLHFMEKVFCDRAGFDVEICCGHVHEDSAEFFRSEDERMKKLMAGRIRKSAEHREKQEEKVQKLPEKREKSYRKEKGFTSPDPNLIYGKDFEGEFTPISELGEDPREVIIRGEVFATAERETKSGRIIFSVSLTDYTDSIRFKLWIDPEEVPAYEGAFTNGAAFLVRGMMDFDPFDKESMIRSVYAIKRTAPIHSARMDNAPEKRVELHCHTKMSDMDGVSSATDIICQAYRWGQKAIAITDHGVVQAFPEAYHTFGGKGGIPADADMKIIYGMEAYLVDDTKSIVVGAHSENVKDPVVVFSTVTTGQSPYSHEVIEYGAQKIENGRISGEFKTLVNTGHPIPFSISQETGVEDAMVEGAPGPKEALERFLEFAKGCVLAAYDADYEMSFIRTACEKYGSTCPETYVDIPAVVRYLMPSIGKIRFARLCKELRVPCENEMRAFPRSQSMALVYTQLLDTMQKEDIRTLRELNRKGKVDVRRIRNLPYYHAIILAKSETGRRNLYRLVSESHLNYFKARPRIPKSLLTECRAGLLLGTACSAGELYQAILGNKSDAEIAAIIDYYDYLEIQPTGNNGYLVRDHISGITQEEDLRNINRRIVKLGEQFHKPVVATCDVHFLNPEDEIYRRIIQVGHGYKDEPQAPLYLRTTEEMISEFRYLGDAKAYEVVVTNSNKVADMIEKISPIYPDKCPPEIPHSEEDLKTMCYRKAHLMYGDPLPAPVEERLTKELTSICKNGYSVMYIIAQKLVAKSLSDGYLVGSRGSVGSSLVATMADITEVNPLPPHYYCPVCHYSDFDSADVKKYAGEGKAGCDMPPRKCPECGAEMKKDGFDIPFETFLGFKGDKEPDIDLNFSGDEQGKAQAYTENIFGKGQTFKAGTIGTVADKTAYGYAMHFFEERNENRRPCELERLSSGCVGVRRTTGQHPGGVIVVPKGMDINWFTPVQHPANDTETEIITTHFDYHSIDKNLLKLDILGHDDPTMIRMLQDLTGEDPLKVPLDDPGVLSLFTGTQALGIRPEDIGGCKLGVLGVPEFGTEFVMGMLLDTQPKTFSELIRISGLSHGTNVWLDNAQEYIKNGQATLGTAICTRDDIMLNLIEWGVEPADSFKIMEGVRKGKGLKPEQEEEMREHHVPDWYIESCKKIKYMFPKAHAAAYVMMAFRIAYYKIHFPQAYYAAYFSIRSTTFSYALMCQGREKLEYHIADFEARFKELSNNEKDTLRDMRIVREMYARGFEFLKLDLYRAKATKFQIFDGKIMPALNSIEGMGDTQAEAVEAAAKRGTFLSKDDFRQRTKVSKTIIDILSELDVLSDIPETNQISLFDL